MTAPSPATLEREKIKAVRGELAAWMERQSDPDVQRAAGIVGFGLGTLALGAEVGPMVLKFLADDVAELSRLARRR